jgi:hypothetical protein
MLMILCNSSKRNDLIDFVWITPSSFQLIPIPKNLAATTDYLRRCPTASNMSPNMRWFKIAIADPIVYVCVSTICLLQQFLDQNVKNQQRRLFQTWWERQNGLPPPLILTMGSSLGRPKQGVGFFVSPKWPIPSWPLPLDPKP